MPNMMTRAMSQYSTFCFARLGLALTSLTCVLAVATPTLGADDGEEETAVNAKLLEDLGADLFDEPEDASDERHAKRHTADRELDQELMGELVQPEGEDIGAGKGATRPQDWLKHVKEQMAKSESLLAARDASGRASMTQQGVVDELDAMIAK